MKQHGIAETRTEMGQLAARVGLPEADAIPIRGRHQPAVGADIAASTAVASRPRSGCRACRGAASDIGAKATSQTPTFPPSAKASRGHPVRSPGSRGIRRSCCRKGTGGWWVIWSMSRIWSRSSNAGRGGSIS